MSEQSSGCSACNQLGQVPNDEHLAGVARFEARQQAATGDHQPSDGRWGPRCSPCEQPWPCRAALEAENARLRAAGETVAIGLRIALDVPNEPDWAHSAFDALAAWSAALAASAGEG